MAIVGLLAFTTTLVGAENQHAASVVVVETNTDDSTAADNVAMKQENQQKIPEFVATHEWKEVLPGQGIPRGLHVRMNLETGKREAKLVDPDTIDDETEMRSVVVDPESKKDTTVTVATGISGDIESVETQNHEASSDDLQEGIEEPIDENNGQSSMHTSGGEEPNWNHEKIYEVLQALPEPPEIEGMDIHDAHAKLSTPEFRKQMIKLWKKRQEELKEAIESMQDDSKYMAELLEQFRDAEEHDDTNEQLRILEVLEWEVQDLDKTHVFNFIGGFNIISEYLNSTNLPVRGHAAWLVGTAAKNYQEGQNWAIDTGAIPKLIDSLTLDVPADSEDNAQVVVEMKKKAVYALSSLVRFNERGQRLFLLHGGPKILGDLFDEDHPMNLQLKAALFVYDLLVEDQEKLSTDESTSLQQIKDIFHSPEWCDRIATFFVHNASKLRLRPFIELVDTMNNQLPACSETFKSSDVKSVVKTTATQYSNSDDLDAEEKQELATFLDGFLDRV